MKIILLLLTISLFYACGNKTTHVYTPCSIEERENQVILTCGNRETVLDLTRTEIIEVTEEITEIYEIVNNYELDLDVIDPCGDEPNRLDEVLIILDSGKILAYYEHGRKRFLTVLKPGSYRTTDYQRCSFSIDEDYNITWED